MEHFITMELPERDALVGYARLRINGKDGVAHLRELKVFGRMVPLRGPGLGWQHRGVGRGLIARAEEMASDQGCPAIQVTSGVGVRPYYAALGYERSGLYMQKRL
jgi:elongator complex protein 3